MKNIFIKIFNFFARLTYWLHGYKLSNVLGKCITCKKSVFLYELVCSQECWRKELATDKRTQETKLGMTLDNYIVFKNCDLEKLQRYQRELNDEINSRKVKCPTCRCRIFPGEKCMCCVSYPTITDDDE